MIFPYKLIMFDMDGTFIDSKDFHTKVFYTFFNKYVKPVSVEQVNMGIGNTVRDIFESFHVPEEEFKILFCKLEQFCREEIKDLICEMKIANDIAGVLDKLRKAGMQTALVTNSMHCIAEQILKYHRLSERFDYISGADFASLTKNVRCEKIRRVANAKPREVLYVGDAEADMILVNDLNYAGCFANTSISWCKDQDYILRVLKPTYCVRNIRELTEIIL